MKSLNKETIKRALEDSFEVRDIAFCHSFRAKTEEAETYKDYGNKAHFKKLDKFGFVCVALFDPLEVKEFVRDGKKLYITIDDTDATLWEYDERGFYNMLDWVRFEGHKNQNSYFVAFTRTLVKHL